MRKGRPVWGTPWFAGVRLLANLILLILELSYSAASKASSIKCATFVDALPKVPNLSHKPEARDNSPLRVDFLGSVVSGDLVDQFMDRGHVNAALGCDD
jgi:hypothetical protein